MADTATTPITRGEEGENEEGEAEKDEEKKDGPGPVMVSDTLCPAVHILGSQNV